MGHAGAIISPGGEGGVKYKRKVLQKAGVHMIEKLSEIAKVISEILLKKGDFEHESITQLWAYLNDSKYTG